VGKAVNADIGIPQRLPLPPLSLLVSPVRSFHRQENPMHEIHAVALFRYSVLGALVSRGRLERGELKATIRELAARDYDIPGSRHSRISEKTIEAWYSAQSKIMRSSSIRKSIVSADSMT
jgi:hypothetical protein